MGSAILYYLTKIAIFMIPNLAEGAKPYAPTKISIGSRLAMANKLKFKQLAPIFLILITCCLTYLVTACSDRLLVNSSTAVPQVVMSILSDVKTFNYALSQESPNIFGLTYAGLVTENPLTGKIEPELAESWQIADNKKQITFILKKDLKWSDGQPLTVDDVVFTYNEIYFNEAIPSNIIDSFKIGVERKLPVVKKLDDRRIEFTVPEPFAPFLGNLSTAILPAHALQESVKKKDQEGKPLFLSKWGVDTNPQEIITNGPYTLASYATSQRIIFERNPYFWRKDEQGNQQPYIQRIIWQIVESTDTALLQFRSGGLDTIGVSPEYFSLLKKEEERGKFNIYNGGAAPGVTFLSFNLNQGKRDGKPLVDPIKSRWFNNLQFRQAVAYGIDRQRMINNIFRGLGDFQDSPLSVQSPFFFKPEQGLPVYKYDPNKSKELLKSAGFKYNDQEQLLDQEGNQVRFSLITNGGNKIREAVATQIKQDLATIGITVDVDTIAFGVLVDKLTNSLNWDSHVLGFTGGTEPNDGSNIWTVKGALHSFNQKPQQGKPSIEGQVVLDWEQRISDLYIKAAGELDEAKRREIYIETQKITQENLPYIYLVNPLSLSAVRDKIQGIKFSALGGAFWNIYELKIAE